MTTVPPDLLFILCETAKALNFTSLYQSQNGLKVFLSAFSVIIIVHMIIKKKHLIYNEHHFMIHFNIASILVFAINNMATHALQITDRLFNPSHPCQWVRQAKQCAVFKAISTSSSNSISTTLFFITIERGIFVILNPTKRVGRMSSSLLNCLQIILSIFFFMDNLMLDHNNSAPVLHCLEDTLRFLPLATGSAVMMSVLDCASLLGSIAIAFYCERAIRRRNQLSRAFLLRQSSRTIRAFLPLIIFHTALFLFWNVSFLYVRPILPQMDKITMKAVNGFFNVSPFYTLIAPLLLLNGLKRLKEGRAKNFAKSVQPRVNGRVVPEGVVYQTALKEMWK